MPNLTDGFRLGTSAVGAICASHRLAPASVAWCLWLLAAARMQSTLNSNPISGWNERLKRSQLPSLKRASDE
jgi:hypothetical protein